MGISRNTDYYGFYRDLAQLFGKKGLFSIRMLSVDGKAIAGTFGLEYDGVFYSLQIVHDREFSRCSPGTYLEALEMEECFKRGYREYEFLGGFLNNKSRWTQSSRQTTRAARLPTQATPGGALPAPVPNQAAGKRVGAAIHEVVAAGGA